MISPTAKDIARYRSNFQGEVDAIALYLAMAEAEKLPQLSEVYRRLATVEEKHASLWEQKLRQAGAPVPPRRASSRTRIKMWLARFVGPKAVLPMIAAAEQADRGIYDLQPEARGTSLPMDERSHARVLNAMRQKEPQGMEGGALARLEGRHRDIGGNALRAAVLGANDGLLSNLSLVMGVAGASLSNRSVIVTGVAGLVAGACSMAIGEWVSVQSSRELNENQVAVEADELATSPAEEQEELALIYEAKGLPQDQAQALAQRLIGDKEKALDTLVREELGINPKDLGGSPWQAALASLCLFSAGALVPILPFLFLHGAAAVHWVLAISALGLFGIGAAITIVTGKSVWISGLRQLIFGLAAAGITFMIGQLIGSHIGG